MKKINVEYTKEFMTTEEKILKIKSLQLFSDFQERELQMIAEISQEKKFLSQEILMEQDENSSSAYFIIEGSVRVFRTTEDGQEVTLALLGPGEIVGEMALVDSSPRSATVQVIQNTSVLSISSDQFSHILKDHPETSVKLLKTLSKKIRLMDEYVENLSTETITNRTFKMLTVLKRYFPNNTINLSHEELALIVGATRARITEALDKLEKENKIILGHRSITLL